MACQIYRCYTVWGSWWKVVSIPIVMLTGTTGKQAYLTLQASLISMPVCGYVAVAKLSRWPVSRTQNDGTWVALAFFCLSLATNLLVTLLIGQNSASSELLVWLTTVVLKLPASIGWAVSFVGRVAIRNIIIQRQLCKSNRRPTTLMFLFMVPSFSLESGLIYSATLFLWVIFLCLGARFAVSRHAALEYQSDFPSVYHIQCARTDNGPLLIALLSMPDK